MNIISESTFRLAMESALRLMDFSPEAVTGPGRSGAIASVYASHFLGVPWIPYGQPCPDSLKPLLIIDTASKTGRTLRKAWAKYGKGEDVKILAVIHEPPRVKFWYETSKRHDRENVARDRMLIKLGGAHGKTERPFDDVLAVYKHNEVPSVLTLGYRFDPDW